MRRHLSPPQATVLEMLITSAPNLVPTEAIEKKLWASSVPLDGVRGMIKTLRQHLGDQATEPRLIDTIPQSDTSSLGSSNRHYRHQAQLKRNLRFPFCLNPIRQKYTSQRLRKQMKNLLRPYRRSRTRSRQRPLWLNPKHRQVQGSNTRRPTEDAR